MAEEVFKTVCEDLHKFPQNRVAWTIGDQLIRSVGSIGANIAEGFNRQTKKDIIHFFIIARGSAAESEVWLLRSREQKLISDERVENLLAKLFRIRKMINSFCAKLRQSKIISPTTN